MAGLIGEGVSLRGFYFNQSAFTWNLTGTIVAADVGKAMTQDITVANSAKLAGDNDPILGVLESFEDRKQEGIKVGTVGHQFSVSLPYAGTVPAIGANVVGSATPGAVKEAVAPSVIGDVKYQRPAVVVEQDVANLKVVVLFI